MTRVVILSVLTFSCMCGESSTLRRPDKASPHLVPCPSVWSATDDQLESRSRFRVTLADAREVQYVVQPSFEPPWAVSIENRDVVLQMFEGSDWPPPSPLPVRRVQIPEDAADFVARAWNYVLDEVRYTDARGEGSVERAPPWASGLDGTTRTFLAHGYVPRCGVSYSDVPPRAASLERIAGMLREYALAPPEQRAAKAEVIRWAAADLLRDWREQDGVAYVVE